MTATATADSIQLANAQKFAPKLAVIESHQALFTKLQADPANKALQAQAVAAVGGGAKGVAKLATLAANQAAIRASSRSGRQLQTVSRTRRPDHHPPYSAQLKTIAPYSAELKAIAPYSAQLTALTQGRGRRSVLQRTTPGVRRRPRQSPASSRSGTGCASAARSSSCRPSHLQGRWRPRNAKQDEEEHEAKVQAELAKLNG